MKKLIYSVLMTVLVVCSMAQNESKDSSLTLLESIERHQYAVHPMDNWMRDPYIILGPDDYYYLTYTLQKDPNAPDESMPLWKSDDLANWELVGYPYKMTDASNKEEILDRHNQRNKERVDKGQGEQSLKLWAPEIHWVGDHWIYTHTSNTGLGNFVQTKGDDFFEISSDWGATFQRKHDPFLFKDDEDYYLVYKCTEILKLNDDLSGPDGDPIKLSPANRKMGHEGAFIIKFEGKYVLFGTGWSTDSMRHGTYNLYYATSDKLEGPYGDRKFAGRFLGHSTLFKDKKGRWWCTAFFNANKAALEPGAAASMDLSETAYTINKQGLTLVPMEIKMHEGDVIVYPKDPAYQKPGMEEVQQF